MTTHSQQNIIKRIKIFWAFIHNISTLIATLRVKKPIKIINKNCNKDSNFIYKSTINSSAINLIGILPKNKANYFYIFQSLVQKRS